MAKTLPVQKARSVPLWALAAFLLPAAAMVYLFIWSQTAEPFSVQTEIRRAAMDLERLALDALRARTADLCEAAMQRPMDPARVDGASPGASLFFSESIAFTLRFEGDGGPRVVEPKETIARTVWPLPGEELENRRYLAYSQDLEGPAFVREDPSAAEGILNAMDEGFDQPGFRVRTILARAAFLRRHDRIEEAGEALGSIIAEIDPAAAPGPEDLPFVVEALLHLGPLAEGLGPQTKELLASMAAGDVPLKASELRAVAARLQSLDDAQKGRLLKRARALDLMEMLRGDGSLAFEMKDRDTLALVRGGVFWLGGKSEDLFRGLAGPSGLGLDSILDVDMLTGEDSGLRVVLEDEAVDVALEEAAEKGKSGSLVRSVPGPAGIEGAVLSVYLTDRPVFERSVASRRTFIVGIAVCLVLAMIVLGFATFRAVRREVAAAKARSDFMAAVSHELRTPLASIRMFAELLEEDRVEEEETKSRFMRLIISNCRRLSAMIENVLDLSRSEKGLLRFELEEIDLQKLLEDLFRDIRAVAEEEGFTMEIHVAKDLPAVRADATALTRAIFNLTDNARKYSGDEKRITIEAVSRDHGARISITDSGPGIAASEREKIFERFRRGHEGLAAPSGAGLGLSLAREAIEGCGGRLELDSREGEGSTFSLYLPGLDEPDERKRPEDPEDPENTDR